MIVAILVAIALTPRYDIVPLPVELIPREGFFHVSKETKIFVEPGFEREANFLSERWGNLKIVPAHSGEPVAGGILLTSHEADEALNDEGYLIGVTPRSIAVRAKGGAGIFYGIQSLIQLGVANGGTVPAVHVRDYPRFSWRGMHLDVGRHFFPMEAIKRYIDTMAFFKQNTFHWHLTEDQGWRIEIKKYPRLTEVSAWRKETVGRPNGLPGDGIPYGGFYTQDEVKQVVEYAAERHVTVVPEIEMPGHSVAALAAYPHLACDTAANIKARDEGRNPFEVSTLWGVREDIFCAGKEETFGFVTDVLDEVRALFPGTFIHIGGDEAPKDRWKACPKCQDRIKKEGLRDEHELQSYFVRRIDDYLTSHGRRLIGWDEILEGGLAENATVMSWRGVDGGIAAANAGHDAVMAPTSHCYLDYYQSKRPGEPEAIGGFTDIEEAYGFEPVPPQVAPPLAKHILGVQGNVWTEYIKDAFQVEYMAWPRGAALAEIGWTPPSRKNFNSFVKRWSSLRVELTNREVNFYSSAPLFKKQSAKIATTIAALEDKPVTCAYDGDPNTQFVSKGGVKVGDTVSITFDEPVEASKIEFQFGPLGNALQGGTIEVSLDGKNWTTVLETKGQHALASFDRSKVYAVSLRVTKDSPHRLIIREISVS